MLIHQQEFARSTPRLPRSFWYSAAFVVAYIVGFGFLHLIQVGSALSFPLQDQVGLAMAAFFSFVLSLIGLGQHRHQQQSDAEDGSLQRRLSLWTPLLFSSALLFQTLGNLLIMNNVLHHLFAFPWWTAVVMGGTYPALLLGVLSLPRHSLSGRLPLHSVLDGMMIIIALITFSWYFTLGPALLNAAGGSLLDVLSGTAFPLFDLLLISSLILLTWSTTDKGLLLAIRTLSVSLAVFVIADSFVTYFTLHHIFILPGWVFMGWAIGNFAIGLSTQAIRWLPGRKSTDGAPARQQSFVEKTPVWRALLPYALVPITLGMVSYVWIVDEGSPLGIGTYSCALALLILVFAKQFVAIREIHLLNRRLADAKRALHENNSALEQANARLESLATTDLLTGLPNYLALATLLEHEGERARRYGHPLSMLFFDGDRFKQVNDTYGHATGDIVLRELGERASSVLRAGDTMGRFGGEEFLVLLPETDEQEARGVAERLRSAVATSPMAMHAVKDGIAVTVSIGVASYPGDGATASEAREQADQAMYWAKRFGRNQVRTAAEAARANRNAELKAVTAHALERQEWAARDWRGPDAQVRVEQLGLIYSLMGVLDWREPGTSEHAQEVSDLVAGMARLLQFDEARVLRATTAAFLHDIGKIALPDRLLQQPRQHFSAQEWHLLHQHAELGAEIVEASPWLSELASAIRHHHERWDGSGDPDGLAGEAIPLEARLIAVAEAYCDMISERSYRAARSATDALKELERCAGTQFDPALLPLFRSVLVSRQEAGAMYEESETHETAYPALTERASRHCRRIATCGLPMTDVQSQRTCEAHLRGTGCEGDVI